MRYIVEEVGDELLVYDLDHHQAYALDPKERKQWKYVRGIVARRAFLATVAATGAEAVVVAARTVCVSAPFTATNNCCELESSTLALVTTVGATTGLGLSFGGATGFTGASAVVGTGAEFVTVAAAAVFTNVSGAEAGVPNSSTT